jgi:hypothetical protein
VEPAVVAVVAELPEQRELAAEVEVVDHMQR